MLCPGVGGDFPVGTYRAEVDTVSDLAACAAREIAWSATGWAEFPYAAEIDGERWSVRVNDFPAEPIYTLFIDGREIGHLESWPETWLRPG